MKPESSTVYQLPVAGSSWISSVELGAGIFFLHGRTHVAGHSSPAEHWLLERGALLVASIRFDREPHETYRPGHGLRGLGPREALQRFGAGSRRS
jgi:hypothetical protein